jgi:DNA-binding beta-propeller fold protein YncE
VRLLACALRVGLVGLSAPDPSLADGPPTAVTELVEPTLTAAADRLFVTHANGTILALDARTLEEVRAWKADGLDAFAVSARGDRMASAFKNVISYGPTDQAKPAWTVKIDGEPKIDSVHVVSTEAVAVVVSINEGKGREGRVVLLDTKAGGVKRTITFKNNYIFSAAANEGWDRVLVTYAASSREDRVTLLDLTTGKQVWDEKVIDGTWVSGLNPKHTRAAASAAGADYEIHAIDLATGKMAGKARVSQQFVSDPVFASAGKYIVARGKLPIIHVVEADRMKVVGEREWPGLQRLAVSPDGDSLYLAAGARGDRSSPATVTGIAVAEFIRDLKKSK